MKTAVQPAPIGITMGDPAGIGPEIIVKALAEFKKDRGYRVIGSRQIMTATARGLGLELDPAIVDDSVRGLGRYQMGKVQRECGQAALQALEIGVTLLLEGKISALVTAPVSKESLRLAGFSYPGQTEFLAQRLGARRYAMLAWTSRFKVVFVTLHKPIRVVSRYITARAVLEKATLLNDFLLKERPRTCQPRIAVLALNPHGEEFSLGEESRIAAGVSLARRAGLDVTGPLPADAAVALSGSGGRRSFDGFLAMYHDQ
ncbi:MAG: 4-hydroxythreonine-4-phosphate dehydrogenase PdxA, partial [candidate division WOR-3 bacterium]